MKNGQLLSEPFTYIFALVVIAMIVSVGFYFITRTTDVAKSVDALKFEKDFESKVTEIGLLSTGSGDEINMNAPIGVKGICFIDMKTINPSEIKFLDVQKDVTLFKEAEKTNLNVFFAKQDGSKSSIAPISVLKLKPNVNPLCVDLTFGKLKLGLENKGKYVEISK